MNFVSVAHLSKSYGDVKAIYDFSFEIDQGEVLALVGPDGAGKTTLMRLVCNLLVPDSGTIRIADLDVAGGFDRLKEMLGYMPQVFSLYLDLSVEENLIFYAGIYGVTGARYRQKRDYLYGFSMLSPFARRRAGDLSGGMKQKLALSCALIHDPQILVLDEPTTGVDPLSRRQFWEILSEFKRQGVTILLTTPYMDEVARADRACFMFGGKKLTEGTPGELTGSFKGELYSLDTLPSTDLIKRLNDIPHLQSRRFGTGLHVNLDADLKIEDVSEALRAAGVDPGHLVPAQAGMEDCFIQLMEQTGD